MRLAPSSPRPPHPPLHSLHLQHQCRTIIPTQHTALHPRLHRRQIPHGLLPQHPHRTVRSSSLRTLSARTRRRAWAHMTSRRRSYRIEPVARLGVRAPAARAIASRVMDRLSNAAHRALALRRGFHACNCVRIRLFLAPDLRKHRHRASWPCRIEVQHDMLITLSLYSRRLQQYWTLQVRKPRLVYRVPVFLALVSIDAL